MFTYLANLSTLQMNFLPLKHLPPYRAVRQPSKCAQLLTLEESSRKQYKILNVLENAAEIIEQGFRGDKPWLRSKKNGHTIWYGRT